MRPARLLLAATLVGSLAVGHAAQAGSQARTSDAAGRYLVKLADGLKPADLQGTLTRLGVTSAVGFETIGSVAITAPRSAVDTLLRSGQAVSARPERKLKLHLAESVAYIGADRATLAKAGKASVRGATMARPGGIDGAGTTVAVLDTGIADVHPDLLGQVTTHRNFELSYAADMVLSPSQLDTFAEATGDSARTDDIGHGTHVAGIVAGNGMGAQKRKNNNRGVAPGAKLVDLRIAAGPIQGFVGDTGWERNAIAAFDWLLRHHKDAMFGKRGIQLSTNSWGLLPDDTIYGKPSYDPLRDIIKKMDTKGLITVFAAGNDGPKANVRSTTVPNGLPEVISVAASCKPGAMQAACDKDVKVNDIGNFSSRGPAVDVAAPGVEIVSTVSPNAVGALAKACAPVELGPTPCAFYRGQYGGPGATPADVAVNYALYGSLHGTSMAAPHIAGVVALLLQANPNLTPRAVQMILTGTAIDRQARGRDTEAGWGLVSVPSALAAAQAVKTTPIAKVLRGFAWKP